jgi:hypothetical protein
MPKIKVKRISQYGNRFSSFELFSNKVELGSIAHGETKEFIVPSGVNEICAKIDWCSSNILILTIGDNETKVLELGCQIKGWKMLLALFYVIFDAENYLYLKEIKG